MLEWIVYNELHTCIIINSITCIYLIRATKYDEFILFENLTIIIITFINIIELFNINVILLLYKDLRPKYKGLCFFRDVV